MKKLFILATILVSTLSYSQVGIGTGNPNPSSDLELGSNNKALLLNRVTNLSAIQSPIPGMIVYDISDDCLKAYSTTGWSSCMTTGFSGFVSELNCSSATVQGGLYAGIPVSGVSAQIPYTGGNGGTYSAQTLSSTGVTGLTATLQAGIFTNGNGNLTYNITGTPSAAGTATFQINKGGKSCSLNIRVLNPIPTIPANITLDQNKRKFIPSIYDQDYWPYTAPSGPANTNTQAADGIPDVLLDLQGIITTNPLTLQIKIPITATGSGSLPAYETIMNVPANLTQDGITRDLLFSWNEQNYTASTQFIMASVTAINGTLNIKKLDLNAGIGNDGLGILLATFNYPYNNAGNMTSYQIRAISGIPDKMYGRADNSGSTTSHMFIYHPIVSVNGTIWLNNNLGANYNNVNNENFNPATMALDINDYNAAGSLFQWGRKPDGHELVGRVDNNFFNSTITPNSSTQVDEPTDINFISSNSIQDWRVNRAPLLWLREDSTNNPCPLGFRVPALSHFEQLITTENISDMNTAYNSTLKLMSVRYRGNNGTVGSPAVTYYFLGTSTFNDNSGPSFAQAPVFAIYTNMATIANYSNRSHGNPVRCVKN